MGDAGSGGVPGTEPGDAHPRGNAGMNAAKIAAGSGARHDLDSKL
jgi:hypothetical protein